MYRIGIDVGSAYTKYCVMDPSGGIVDLSLEKTAIRQREYFPEKLRRLREQYGDVRIVSCGYGKKNVPGLGNINELTALARGVFYSEPESDVVLDIGGQDTKVIVQSQGQLKRFFLNDRCAAGSGLFLANTSKLLETELSKIDLTDAGCPPRIRLSSVCAVFAQSEIVELIAENTPSEEILRAVVWQILVQAKALLGKVGRSPILLSGGLTQIPGIGQYARHALECECRIPENGNFLSAIGCALCAADCPE